jgi:ZIP family zinc transporter
MVLLIALAAIVATFLGGLFALKFKDQLHLILGFSAGAVLGVAFFDLIPESINLGQAYFDVSTILSVIALGFAVFMILDRFLTIHSHNEEDCDKPGHRGVLGASSLSIHSFLDGIAIGLAFKVSPAVGAIVAAAVLTHDFSDGINTVSLILKNNGSKKQAFSWLLVDALAPALGVMATFFFTLPEPSLALVLALFSGFFFYIGASDLLPESHHRHPARWTTFATLLGMIVIYVVVKLAGA